MRVTVIGATGATGKDLIQELITHPEFTEIHVLVRRPLLDNHPKLIVHEVNFAAPDEWQSKVQGEIAFCCMGTTLKQAGSQEAQMLADVTYPTAFANAARDIGVQHFILVSAAGADAHSRLFYPRLKGMLEDNLRKLNFPKLTIFQPGMLLRKNSDRFGEKAGAAVLQAITKTGLAKKYRPLPTSVLAKAMVNAAFIKSSGESIIKLDNIFSFAKKNP